MHALAMLIILKRHFSCLKTNLRWCHVILSGPGANKLLHLLIALLNLCIEKSSHKEVVLLSILLSTLTSTWQLIVWLNILWRAPHRLSGVMHSYPLNLIASVASNLHLLIQFINSQGPWLLFATSWIFRLKKEHLVFLTTLLNIFQFSRLLIIL